MKWKKMRNKKESNKTIEFHAQDDYTKGTGVVSLGRIGCMLSDKTGTLTSNEMHLYGYEKMEKGGVIEKEEICEGNYAHEKGNGALTVKINTGINALQKIVPKQMFDLFSGQKEQKQNEYTEIDDVIKNGAKCDELENGNVDRRNRDIVDRNICSGVGVCIIKNGNYIPIVDPRNMMNKNKDDSTEVENSESNSNNNTHESKRKRSHKNISFRSCVRQFLLCNSVYVDGDGWDEFSKVVPKKDPVFRASSAEEVALAEFCYMNTSTTIARREEKDVILNIGEEGEDQDGPNVSINNLTLPCILTFKWPSNSHTLNSTNMVTVREYAILHIIPFNSTLKRMSVIVQRIKKYVINTDNEDELTELWDTSKRPYNYGKIRVITKGADSAIVPLLARRSNFEQNNDNDNNDDRKMQLIPKNSSPLSANTLLQVSDTYARGGLRTLAFCERVLKDNEFLEIYKLINTANNSNHAQEILKKVNEIIPYESFASCVIGIEDKLQKGVRESIVNLRSAGIPVWMLTGDKVETALSVASQCGIIADASHTYIFEEDKAGVDPLLTLAQKVNSPRRDTYGTTTVCANSNDVAALQREHLLKRFVSLVMKADGVVLCRLTPEQKELVAKYVGEEMKKKDMAVCAIGDGGNDVKMIKEAEVGIGIVGKEGRMAALASDIAVSNFENAQKFILIAGKSAYYRYTEMWKVLICRGIRLGFICMFFVAASGFVPLTPISSISSIFYSTLYTGIPLIQIVWDYGDEINVKSILNKIPQLKPNNGKRLPFYTQTRNRGGIKPSVYREQSRQTIISPNTLIKQTIIAFVQTSIIFAVLYAIYGRNSLSSVIYTLVLCCIIDCLRSAEKKTVGIIVSSVLSLIFTIIVLAFIDKSMPSTLTFIQICISSLLAILVSFPLSLIGKYIERKNNKIKR